MPPIKLSRIVYVPRTPARKNPGRPGGDLDLDTGAPIALPDDALHCALNDDALGKFLDAIIPRNIDLTEALELAMELYVRRLETVVKNPDPTLPTE